MRRNCKLLVHEIEENKDGVTDELVASFIKDKIENELSVNEIDRTRRIGKLILRKKRPIIVTFVRYNDRRKVFAKKKKLIWNIVWKKIRTFFKRRVSIIL